MSIETRNTLVTPQDKPFYEALGKRIALLRKAQGLTQTQVAEVLGISQKTQAHYEGGKLRIPVALLPTLATLLRISVEEIVIEPTKTAKKKPGPTSKLERQIEQVSSLPRSKQKFITEMLDALIQQQQQAS